MCRTVKNKELQPIQSSLDVARLAGPLIDDLAAGSRAVVVRPSNTGVARSRRVAVMVMVPGVVVVTVTPRGDYLLMVVVFGLGLWLGAEAHFRAVIGSTNRFLWWFVQ